VAGVVAEDRRGGRQERHRAWLVGISPARWRIALPVAERAHGLEVAVADARLVDAAMRVQPVGLGRPCCWCGGRRRRRPAGAGRLRSRAAGARRDGPGHKDAGGRRSGPSSQAVQHCLPPCLSPVASTLPHTPGFRLDADGVVSEGEEPVLADVAHGGPGQFDGGHRAGEGSGDQGGTISPREPVFPRRRILSPRSTAEFGGRAGHGGVARDGCDRLAWDRIAWGPGSSDLDARPAGTGVHLLDFGGAGCRAGGSAASDPAAAPGAGVV